MNNKHNSRTITGRRPCMEIHHPKASALRSVWDSRKVMSLPQSGANPKPVSIGGGFLSDPGLLSAFRAINCKIFLRHQIHRCPTDTCHVQPISPLCELLQIRGHRPSLLSRHFMQARSTQKPAHFDTPTCMAHSESGTAVAVN